MLFLFNYKKMQHYFLIYAKAFTMFSTKTLQSLI